MSVISYWFCKINEFKCNKTIPRSAYIYIYIYMGASTIVIFFFQLPIVITIITIEFLSNDLD